MHSRHERESTDSIPQEERFLADGATGLTLGRREGFFGPADSASMASPAEYKMRFRARVATAGQFAVLLKELGDKACLGLFSAADHLGMGHVSGVPPYIYMHKLPALGAKNLTRMGKDQRVHAGPKPRTSSFDGPWRPSPLSEAR